jgi:tryptophan synthase alpha chain
MSQASANRIDETFRRLRADGGKAFVAYVCAGDPHLDKLPEIVAALEQSGADIIELGLPFSDPLADGIVNQMAAQRALEAGATTAKVLAAISKVREQTQIPLVAFTYLNPVYAYGFERFHTDAAAAGADGVLLLDLPPDEAPLNEELSATGGMRRIRLIAPTTPPERMKQIAATAEGFIYYISREGVTGQQTTMSGNIAEQVQAIKSGGSGVPVCVGFGISTPEHARVVAEGADGVVVGSAIVNVIAKHGQSAVLAEEIVKFVKPLVDAAKSVRG